MKINTLNITTTALIAVIVACSCNSAPKNNPDTSSAGADTTVVTTAVDTAGQAKKDWESFKADAREKIRENNDSIEAFKARVDKSDKKMKAKLDERIEKMKQKNEELKARLDDFKEEGKEKWEKFKYDFKRDMDTLDVHWKELTKQDKKG